MTIRPGFMAALAGLFMTLGAFVFSLRIPHGHEVNIAVSRTDNCGDGPRRTVLHVEENGQALLNGEAVHPSEVPHRLHEIFASRAERLLFLTAAPHVAFERVAAIIDVAGGEVDHVALLTASVQNAPGTCLGIAVPPFLDFAFRPPPPVQVKAVPVWRIWE